MPTLTVDKNGAGQRLDRYLGKILGGMPRSHIFKLIRTRKVRVNGKRAKPQQMLDVGDTIIVHLPPEAFERVRRIAGDHGVVERRHHAADLGRIEPADHHALDETSETVAVVGQGGRAGRPVDGLEQVKRAGQVLAQQVGVGHDTDDLAVVDQRYVVNPALEHEHQHRVQRR